MSMIPERPSDLGILSPDWWTGQREAAEWLADFSTYAKILVAPTGAGKTLIGLAAPLAAKQKTIYLTSTKRLQDQQLDVYPKIHLFKGQNNYVCIENAMVMVDEGRCHAGWPCPIRDQCFYYVAKRRAATEPVTSMNYAVWLTDRMHVGRFDPPEVLVLDEAHNIERELMSAVEIQIRDTTCGTLRIPRPGRSLDAARRWAVKELPDLSRRLDAMNDLKRDGAELPPAVSKEYRALKSAKAAADKIMRIGDIDNWVVEADTDSLILKPVMIAPYSRLMWEGAGRLLLMSATIPNVPYFAESVGLPDYDSLVLPSNFDPRRSPIVMAPIETPMNHRTEGPGTTAWKQMVARIDEILDRPTFKQEKGLIHSGSYERARYIYEHSRHTYRIVKPEKHLKDPTLRRWKQAKPGSVLLSPSIWEGVDLPAGHAEFQIIPKVHYPYLGSAQIARRIELDPLYAPAQTGLFLAQAAGRVMRNPDDKGVTFITDPAGPRFVQRHPNFLPGWFHDRIVRRAA